MNGLEEIQGIVKKFIDEKQGVTTQIANIEAQRNQLAEERNEKKANNSIFYAEENKDEIIKLGKQICDLGNQSQELQNKLDARLYDIKNEVNYKIDNLITEGIRQIKQIEDEKQELENSIHLYNEQQARYEHQKEDFFARFGRIPALSSTAQEESHNKCKAIEANKARKPR